MRSWTVYDELRIIDGDIKWTYSGFETEVVAFWRLLQEAGSLHLLGSKVDYLQAQRELIEADDAFDCELTSVRASAEPHRPATATIPFLRPLVTRRGKTVRAKAIIYRGKLTGVLHRPGSTPELFLVSSASAVATWMLEEAVEPSLNFCTVER